MEFVGSFVVEGKLIVTDPCYSRDTWCMGALQVKPGTWEAYVDRTQEGSWGVRISQLTIKLPNEKQTGYQEKADFEVGVDSGQAGFFNDSVYPTTENMGEYDDKNSFYGAVCELTLSNSGVGIYNNSGVVSSSGYGDGGYNCYVCKNEAGEIVEATIVFIEDYEEEEEDYYYDDDEDLDEDLDEEGLDS